MVNLIVFNVGEADATSKASAAISDVLRMVLEPPTDQTMSNCNEGGGTKKRRDMSVDHNADLTLMQRYVEVRKQLHEAMQDETGNEVESNSMQNSSNDMAAETQQQPASASSGSNNKVRVKSGGNDGGGGGGSNSSSSGGNGSKVVMM